jgi:hypothetical protein
VRPGLINLNWETGNIFSTFPPKSHYSFSEEMSLSKFKSLLAFEFTEENNVVFIFWTNMLQRQSRILIETVKKHLQEKNINAQVILVNMDRLYYHDSSEKSISQ